MHFLRAHPTVGRRSDKTKNGQHEDRSLASEDRLGVRWRASLLRAEGSVTLLRAGLPFAATRTVRVPPGTYVDFGRRVLALWTFGDVKHNVVQCHFCAQSIP